MSWSELLPITHHENADVWAGRYDSESGREVERTIISQGVSIKQSQNGNCDDSVNAGLRDCQEAGQPGWKAFEPI